jgi:hypothetical protein
MDKRERMELVRKRITILRSQFEPRKNCYKIAKATLGGGWSHFGTGWYITGGDADRKIDEIVLRDPQHYKKD